MSTKKKQPPEVPAAGAFYNLFASKSTGSPPAGEPHSNVSLRQKAEAHFRERESQSSEKIEALSPESMRTILHELRVHQIELEMQNEELRQTQADLVTSQARYFDLYALAPVGYITVSEEGMVLEANLTAANLLGVVRGALVNQPVTRFFLKEDQDIYHKFCRQLFETGEPQQCELRMVKQDGTTFWAHLSATAAQAPDGEPACRVVLSDVSGRMAAEKSLAMLALRNKTLLQSASDGIHVLDDQGNVVEANASFCRMLGYTHDEAMRLNVADWDAQWSREELLVKIREFIARPCVFETRHRRKDGTLLDVEISGVGVTLDGQDYLYASARDITGRKQAEDQLAVLNQQNKLILNSAAEGILGLDLQGKHTFINPAAAKMLGCEAEELLGHYSHSVWHHTKPDGSPYPKEECPIYAAYLDGTTHSSSTEVFWRKDGTNFPVEYASTPIFEKGRLTGAVVTFADITGRKEMEAKLLEALARAEAADRAKSEFLGVMSHELRTPLNGVLGFSELLSDTPLNDEQKDFVRTISSCGDHLLAIVNDILDFSSIVAGALAIHVAPLAVAEVVKKSENTVRKIAADKGIEFRCEVAAGVPEQIAGDELRICQILINLLGNAVKFTASGSVVLRVAPASDLGRRSLDFCVEDTGIGISSETLSHLFQPFVQADSKRNRPFGGTGLGLAISRRLAEAMGGAITVASTPGKGSTFTFRLPLESVCAGGMAPVPSHLFMGADGASLSSPSAETSMPHEGKLVLVVDDDQASSVIAGKMLQSLGFRAEFAANGVKALKAFVPGKFSAILMDMAMPVMDGLVATRKIREVEATAKGHVPIIAFTANVMPDDRERCLAAGMDDFLAKPFKKAELAAKLACVAHPSR